MRADDVASNICQALSPGPSGASGSSITRWTQPSQEAAALRVGRVWGQPSLGLAGDKSDGAPRNVCCADRKRCPRGY